MSEEKNYIECSVKIKKAKAQYMSDWKKRQQENKRIQEQLKVDFYLLVNAIVAAGGVVQLEKYHLDSEWRLVSENVNVKIPDSQITKIQKLPFVETCKKR